MRNGQAVILPFYSLVSYFNHVLNAAVVLVCVRPLE